MSYMVCPRELKLGIPASNMLAMSSSGLSETVIHENSVAAADPIEDAVEDLLMLLSRTTMSIFVVDIFGFIEAEQHEIVHRAAGLGVTGAVHALHVSGNRIGGVEVVRLRRPQESGKITQCSKTEPGNDRV